ncbi:MAG: 6-phosphofructokinase [Paludibacteraceae bacterium]|nr:6-phosphofructokinase [Paludibacteraceae bacterium]
MEYVIKCVGVLTSGGDSPAMNAAIRAVVRAGISNGIKVKGIYRGYSGLIDNEIRELTTQDVSGIIQRGGTILKSSRCPAFTTPEGRKQAYDNLVAAGIDALIVIGGDGTFTGARIFAQEFNVPIIGLPGTIDNDLWGTDSTIGYDTSLNTIMDCVDILRDTATSHERVFLVEVMGRDAGFLTLNAAIAAGAEAAIIPERSTIADQLEEAIGQGRRKSKNSSIVLVQEHAIEGGAQAVAKILEKTHPEYNVRVTILGHLQRGGSPTAQDRILASRMGIAAIQALLEEQRSIMIGIQNEEIAYVPLSKAINIHKDIKSDKWAAMQVLSL